MNLPELLSFPASSDDTVQITPDAVFSPHSSSPIPSKSPRPISHPTAVRCFLPLPLTDLAEPYIITGAGDIIRIFDIASLEEPELVGQIDGHWHDVTGLQMWMRRFVGSDGRTRVEPWIISASLDGTIRKWRLSGEYQLGHPYSGVLFDALSFTSELLSSLPSESPDSKSLLAAPAPALAPTGQFELSKEEEDELAALLDSD
jgi:WD40 repeat protein